MKKSRYANIIRGEHTYLIHQALYGGIIRVSDEDAKAFLDMIDSTPHFDVDENNNLARSLIIMHMIVDDDVQEDNLANYHYSQLQQKTLRIIPFVTNQCNFRCVYCYEEHVSNRMSDEIYDEMLSAIEQLIEKHSYKQVQIAYFGGEPLLEYEAICKFSNRVNSLAKRKGIRSVGGMTTNGYLLSIDRLKKLVEQNITEYMVTVDGLAKTHNRQRPLVGGRESWSTVVGNLLAARDSDLPFHIVIRTNFDEEISENVDEYLSFLADNFKDDPRFGYHFEAVKKLGGENDENLDVVTDEADSSFVIMRKAREFGLDLKKDAPFLNPFGAVCYAAKNDCIAVDYDGTLKKCTVCLDDPINRVGQLKDGRFNINDSCMSVWTSDSLDDACKTCKILPICYGRKCPAVQHHKATPCEHFIHLYESYLRALYL